VLSKPILATGLTAKIFLPSSFIFIDNQSHVATKEIGNCTSDTDLTFSFKVRDPTATPIDRLPKTIPIQTQLAYSRPDGARVIRLITKSYAVTGDRDQIERDLNAAIVSMRAVQHAATLAQTGDFLAARTTLISTQRLIQNGMTSSKTQREYINFIIQAEKLDGFMRQAQAQADVLGSVKGMNQGKDDSSQKNIVQMKQAHFSLFADRVN
jgi:hypothetical protein